MSATRRTPTRVTRALLIGAAVIVLLGAAIAGWRLADVGRVVLETGIAAATGASVSLESGGFTLTDGLTLRARNFQVAWPERSTAIEGRSLTLSVELLPLLRRRLVVRQIAMEHGRVVLGESPVDFIEERSTRFLRLDLGGAELRLEDVTLRYGGARSTQAGDQGLLFQGLTLQASRREGSDAAVSFAFSAENSGPKGPLPLWLPQVGGKGRLLLRGSEIVFDETVLDLGDMRIVGAGRGQPTDAGLSLNESQWSTQDIAFSLSGQASFAGTGAAYVLHLSVPEVAVSALRSVPPLASLWSAVGPLATAEGSVGVELSLRPEKTSGAFTLHAVALRLDDRLPPATLTGVLDFDGESLVLRKIQGRIGANSFEIEGRVEDAVSSQWSVEAGIRSTLVFPAALGLVPTEVAGRIDMLGSAPLTGRIVATAAGGSLEVSASLGELERLDLFGLRKRAAASGRLKIRTLWEAGKDVSSAIDLSLSQGEVFALPAEDVSVHALLRGGVFQFENIRFSLEQGRVEGEGRIESSAADADLRVREAEVNTFVSHLLGAPDRLYGKLSMDVHLGSTGTSRPALLRGAAGYIEVVVEDGRLENVDLPAQLLQTATLAHEGILDFNFSRTFKTVRPEPVDHFELLSGRFDIAEGVARTENLVFVAHNLVLQAEGTVELASGALDFVIEGQVPKEPRDHAGLIDRALGPIRIGKVLDLLRKVPGSSVVLGEAQTEHVFRLRLSGNLNGEKKVSDFAWVH